MVNCSFQDGHNNISCPICCSRTLLIPHQVMVTVAPILETGWVFVTALTNKVQIKCCYVTSQTRHTNAEG